MGMKFLISFVLLGLAMSFLITPRMSKHLKLQRSVSQPKVTKNSTVDNVLAGVKMTSGYAVIDADVGAATWYWHFPATKGKARATIIWLTGGPGCSSTTAALFERMSPLELKPDGKGTYQRANSWSDFYDVIYVDNPIGVGYSTYGSGQSRNNTVTSAHDFVYAVKIIQDQHPQWFARDLYIFGESFGGHYVPTYAYYLIKDGGFPQLRGIGVGDGWHDPINQLNHNADYAYSIGLIDIEQWVVIQGYEMEGRKAIQEGRMLDALNSFGQISELIELASDGVNIYNARNYDDLFELMAPAAVFMNLNSTKDMFNVPRDKQWMFCDMDINEAYSMDNMKSYAYVFPLLFKNIKVLLYNAQDDIIINTPAWDTFVNAIEWEGQKEFVAKDRNPWKVGEEIKGYVKTHGPLTQLIVLKAGHMVPMNQPDASREMINNFILDRPWQM